MQMVSNKTVFTEGEINKMHKENSLFNSWYRGKKADDIRTQQAKMIGELKWKRDIQTHFNA